MQRISNRFVLAATIVAATVGTSGCGRRWPPALTGVTIVASDDAGVVDPRFVARTLLAPPVPVIGLRPGIPPHAGSLVWNEPTRGQISITLARGTQSFTFHTTVWRSHPRYVVALFLDHERTPAFVVDTATPNTAPSVAALDLEGKLLPPQPTRAQVVRRGFEVSLVQVRFPLPLQLDLIGPWGLRPDNIADAIGTFTLTVRDLQPATARVPVVSAVTVGAALRAALARFRALSL